jgi:ADP-ribose pyrophosphatase YjhB (NUDIX family)
MVKENKQDNLVLNQPAGHVENYESLIQAVEREVREETGWKVKTEHLLGLYSFTPESGTETYHRVCFVCLPIKQESEEIDKDISQALWLTQEQILKQNLRSPLVKKCLEDYLAGTIYPLSIISDKHL